MKPLFVLSEVEGHCVSIIALRSQRFDYAQREGLFVLSEVEGHCVSITVLRS